MDLSDNVGYKANKLGKQHTEEQYDKYDTSHCKDGTQNGNDVFTHGVIVCYHGAVVVTQLEHSVAGITSMGIGSKL